MEPRRKGILLIIGAALLWSTGGIGIKAIADSALKVTFYRSLFAAVALMLFLGRGVWARRQWKSTTAFIIAIISYGGCLTSFVIATKWTTAANAIFLQYAGVVWVLLFSPLVVREPMRTRDAAAITVAFAGMALFFVGRFEAHGMAGNAMALLSSVFFASLILVLRREQRAAQAAVTWGNVVCALAVLPFVAHDLALTPRSFAVLAFLGIFQIAIAYVLFVRGLAFVTATQASLTGMLEPVSNPIWVFLFLGERPSVFAIAGALVVLAAIAGHTLAGEPAMDLPAPD
ncbi:MAG TPA: DMT family transporter [Thermoanaerobaculia bacterium]|jgi:drug/metabolite transporter (DMT)-like permease|nr:DMT family transporter [Thermoanaerobaculia bacterium]